MRPTLAGIDSEPAAPSGLSSGSGPMSRSDADITLSADELHSGSDLFVDGAPCRLLYLMAHARDCQKWLAHPLFVGARSGPVRLDP